MILEQNEYNLDIGLKSKQEIRSENEVLLTIEIKSNKITNIKNLTNNFLYYKIGIDNNFFNIIRNGYLFPFFTIENGQNNNRIAEFKPYIDGHGYIKFVNHDIYSFSGYNLSDGKSSIERNGEIVIDFIKKTPFSLKININTKYKDDKNIKLLIALGSILVLNAGKNIVLKLMNIENY